MFRGSPPQLPTLVRGQRVQQGPYMVTVTDELVRERERQNMELAMRWQRAQQPAQHTEYFDAFDDPKVRRRFVGRVFGIVTLQLLFTVWLVAVCVFVENARKAVKQEFWLGFIAMIGFMVAFFTILISQKARRGTLGVVCLFVLTVCTAYGAVDVSVRYSTWSVLFAAGMTTIIALTIALSTACTSFDFTRHDGFISLVALVGGMCLMTLFLLKYLLMLDIIWLDMLIATCGSLILSMLLLYEVHTIMGGRVIALLPEEVVYATAQLYVQIVFMYRFLLLCRC